MLTRLALGHLDCDIGFVDSILLVIVIFLININFIFFIIFAVLLLVSERSAGFLFGLIFLQMFEVVFKVILVIFFELNFVEVLNKSLLFFSLSSSLRLLLSLYR